jgi:hypothetical protein
MSSAPRPDDDNVNPPPPGAANVKKLRDSLNAAEQGEPVTKPANDPAPESAGPKRKPPKSRSEPKPDRPEKPKPEWIKVVDPRTLPDDCPVKPLGMTPAGNLAFLTTTRMLRVMEPRAMTKTQLPALFTPRLDYLDGNWPKFNKDGLQNGWDPTRCGEALIQACGHKPIFDEAQRLRGRGAHRDSKDQLVLHTGSGIIAGGTPQGPDEYDGAVYPRLPPYIGPAESDAGCTEAAQDLLELFKTWNWERPLADPLFLLGFAAMALVGGALVERPVVWITGDKGTGKSTLTDKDGVISYLFGEKSLTTSDTTAAGIYQPLKHDTVLVQVDELENKRENKRAQAVVELARAAYRGALVLRGGADGHGSDFVLRAPFLFSSINIPPLKPQDMSRLCVLALGPLPKGQAAPVLDKGELARIGQIFLARWVARWAEWEQRLTRWSGYLMLKKGFDQRGAKLFGTLLAAAHLMLDDAMPDEDVTEEWAGWMSADNMAETAGATSNSRGCIDWMLSRNSPFSAGGKPRPIGELVDDALARHRKADDAGDPNDNGCLAADRELARCGFKIVCVRASDNADVRAGREPAGSLTSYARSTAGDRRPGQVYLAVANQGEGILRVFQESDWQGDPGAINPFTRALLRAPFAQRSGEAMKFGGWTAHAVLLPLSALGREEPEEEA